MHGHMNVKFVKFHGQERVELYIYSLYRPYSLYRASVPVQYNYTSTPLWTVRPVQNLSACTV